MWFVICFLIVSIACSKYVRFWSYTLERSVLNLSVVNLTDAALRHTDRSEWSCHATLFSLFVNHYWNVACSVRYVSESNSIVSGVVAHRINNYSNFTFEFCRQFCNVSFKHQWFVKAYHADQFSKCCEASVCLVW